MRVPGRKTAQRFAHWLRSRPSPRAVVLGCDATADDPFGLSTSPERFREHLEVLADETTPLGMWDLIEG